MPKRTFQLISPGDPNLVKIQKNIQAAITDISTAQELNPSYISVDTHSSTDILVDHQLGRTFQYYQIVRSTADVRVWDSPTTNNNPSKQLILRASGAATVTLKVT